MTDAKTDADSRSVSDPRTDARSTIAVDVADVVELGAVPTLEGTRFALWSTTARTSAVRLFASGDRVLGTEPLVARGEGIFERTLPGVRAGALYKFVLDGRELPDPYARYLPFGVHGPARVEPRPGPAAHAFVAPALDRWVIYELHVGTFTAEGTWTAARAKLDALVELGINAIEVMPIGAFAGERGWGYDGVALFAPFAPYGEPDELRAFIAACHQRRIAVILDVVYNHLGPSGNYLGAYSPQYFSSQHKGIWGDAPDFAEPHLRRLVLGNARYWLSEVGFDGLRLDATHTIVDDSASPILAEIAALAGSLTPGRVVIAEDARNDPSLVTGFHLDALWADDFHHVVHTLLTGERDGHYGAFAPTVLELARTIEQGWRFEGEFYPPWKAPRGAPALPLVAANFVYALQNHDHVGNRPFGTRLHHETGIEAHLAAAMLLLFLPMVPLLFMGEEWAASSPFLYFTDHEPELGRAVAKGRYEEFSQFDLFSDPAAQARIPDPQARSSFERSRLDWDERTREPHARVLALYRRMLALRARDPVLCAPARARTACEVRGPVLFVRRWLGAEERLLFLNAGTVPAPLPFPLSRRAEILVASTAVPPPRGGGDEIPARAAVIVSPPR